jgi:hypothetical protein
MFLELQFYEDSFFWDMFGDIPKSGLGQHSFSNCDNILPAPPD